MNKPKIQIPDPTEKIDIQIEALRAQIVRETKEIDRFLADREIHRRALDHLEAKRVDLLDKEIFNSENFLLATEHEEME